MQIADKNCLSLCSAPRGPKFQLFCWMQSAKEKDLLGEREQTVQENKEPARGRDVKQGEQVAARDAGSKVMVAQESVVTGLCL